MPFHKISDPIALQTVIDSILSIEADDDLSGLLTNLVEQATALVGARFGALGVLSGDGGHLSQFITVGLSASERALIGRFPTGEGVLGQVISHPTPLRLDDLSSAASSTGFPEHHPPMTSFLGVPVRLEGGAVYGNLYLCDKITGTQFTEEDEALADTLGRAAGLLIDKARMQIQAKANTLAEERNRMARDLHDTVIQRLFAVGLSLQATRRFEASEEVHSRITQAIEDLDGTIREIRTTIFAISRPNDATGGSIGREILDLCDEVTDRLGIEVTVSLEGPLDERVGAESAEHLLAALREGLSNVVRHSSADRAHVAITVDASGLQLRLWDNGTGPALDLGRIGNGIENLRTRAQELEGWCELRNGDDGGTLLIWHAARLTEGTL